MSDEPHSTPRRTLLDRSAATPPTRPATGSDTVVIGCKLPMGLFISRYELRDVPVPGTNEAGTVKQCLVVEDTRFFIRGPNSTLPTEVPSVAGVYPALVNSGNYALTSGVPKDLWDFWYQHNRQSDLVKN